MVEWEDDDLTRTGKWVVEWEGKSSWSESESVEQSDSNIKRVYFLLQPDTAIPPVISLSYLDPGGEKGQGQGQKIQLNPLPAIFPPSLVDSSCVEGKKGVLHTIWAKGRLHALEREIREECLSNGEGVALQMALREREWIQMNFGVSAGVSAGDGDCDGDSESQPIITPISPTGKLGEKLKGLKLRTARDCTAATNTDTKPVPQYPSPFESIRSSYTGSTSMKPPDADDLFAKALSPRSPDLPRSPFSFA